MVLLYSTLHSLLFYSTFPLLKHHLPKKTGVYCPELSWLVNHQTEITCCLTDNGSNTLLDNLSSFQTVMTLCVWFVIKVPASILSHGLLENMCTLQIRKERQDMKNVAQLKCSFNLMSCGKYPARFI